MWGLIYLLLVPSVASLFNYLPENKFTMFILILMAIGLVPATFFGTVWVLMVTC